MKNLRNITIVILASMVFILGAGIGFVHICSTYCKTQMCSSSSHSCSTEAQRQHSKCCNNSNHIDDDTSVAVAEKCSCLNLSYNIDLFKLAQEDNSQISMPMVIDILEFFVFDSFKVNQELSYWKPANAPPLMNGRFVLALKSVLII